MAARTHAVTKLVYSAITSLDGYVPDEAGKFEWSEPDAFTGFRARR